MLKGHVTVEEVHQELLDTFFSTGADDGKGGGPAVRKYATPACPRHARSSWDYEKINENKREYFGIRCVIFWLRSSKRKPLARHGSITTVAAAS